MYRPRFSSEYLRRIDRLLGDRGGFPVIHITLYEALNSV